MNTQIAITNRKTMLRQLILWFFTVTAMTLTTVSVNASAANIKPTAAVLTKDPNYYRAHQVSLAKHYRLAYGAMTGLTNNGEVRLYIATTRPDVKKSVNLAMQYWNQKLGRKMFVMGTRHSYTLTVAMSNQKVTSTDNSDAWWLPKKQLIQIRSSLYNAARSDLRKKMMAKSTADAIKTANKNLANYTSLVKNDSDAANLIEKYRLNQVSLTEKKLTAISNDITKRQLAKRARIFEYADTLAHEFGHVLGLKHSPNKKDLMYWQSGTPKVYNYAAVKRSKRGFNLLTQTDTARAKLAIKIYKAFH